MRAGFVFSEVRIGLRRNLTMTFAVVITVAISLLLRINLGDILKFDHLRLLEAGRRGKVTATV